MSATLDQIQNIQSALAKTQMQYRDNTREFWALCLAWECTRLAWYVVRGDVDTANEKLASVRQALSDYERIAKRAQVSAGASPVYCGACDYKQAPGKLGVAVWDPQRQGHYCDKCGAFVDVSQVSERQ